jgi:hypothetical protein
VPLHFRAWRTLTGGGPPSEPWGAGLVDEGFDPLGSTLRWDDVSADELVFLWPGLKPAEGRARLAPILAEALARREAGRLRDDPVASAHAAAWLRGLRDAIEASAPLPGEPGPLEAACLAWETGVNGAYLVPAAELLHETMAAAAWLGHACRGRDALLPPMVQSIIAERLAEGDAPDGDAPSVLVSSYLSCRVRQAGLGAALRRAGRHVARTGAPALVRAVAGPPAPLALPTALRATLARSAARITAATQDSAAAGRRA